MHYIPQYSFYHILNYYFLKRRIKFFINSLYSKKFHFNIFFFYIKNTLILSLNKLKSSPFYQLRSLIEVEILDQILDHLKANK
jgi:hypothetical protein